MVFRNVESRRLALLRGLRKARIRPSRLRILPSGVKQINDCTKKHVSNKCFLVTCTIFVEPTHQNPKPRRTDPRHPEAPEQRQISRSKVSGIPRGLLYFQKTNFQTRETPTAFYFLGRVLLGVTPLPKDRYRIVDVRKQGFRKLNLPP